MSADGVGTPVDAKRREFLKTTAIASAGLLIGFFVPGAVHRVFAQGAPKKAALPAANAFLKIGADNSVTVIIAHSEMGQGIWTALPMLVAEELDCEWSKIKVQHAPAAPTYAHTAFGMQMTGGSSSTYSEIDRYRQVGAVARTLLIQAAADQWKVKPSDCKAQQGYVTCGSHKASYGELAEAANKLPTPAEVVLKDRKDWKLIGQPTRRLDTPEKINGKAKFGMDVQFEGLLTAVIARAPVFGGKVKSFDATAAKAIKGVRDVVQVPSGVAVLADNYWSAKTGRDALKVDWDAGPNAGLDTGKMREQMRGLAQTAGAKAAAAGDAKAALAKAKTKLEAEYELPYLAHATMEPLNCTVKIDADKCDIWTGTQFQTNDQMVAAKILGIKPEQITIHTMFLGGGFGRRANPASDFVAEAVEVAKASKKPVKVVWTREDDMRGGYYRPMWLHKIVAGLDDEGAISGWHNVIVGQSIIEGTPFAPMMIKDGVDATSVEGAADSPYLKTVSDHLVELHSPNPGIPVLWWRSVGNTHTAFVVESFIDELAHAAKQDPLAFRRALLTRADAKRHLAVLNKAAQEFGWDKPLPKGHGKGIAVHESFNSYVAQAVEVSVDKGQLRVHRVVAAIDCGIFVNPESIRAQIEGGIVFGLSAALYGEITFKDGKVLQSNFHDYPVLRMPQMPKVDVHIVDSGLPAGGVGEPGTPPIAPAVANAVFAATGKRLRQLPLRLA
jgi:isoquinoline 1-oxidoreductase subunit beta